MKRVLVFGTFDGVHKEHINFLKQAKEFGDYLIVVIAKDETVKKLKGKFPIRDEMKRIKELSKYKIANEIRLGNRSNPYKVLKEVKSDVICLGYDQKFFVENLPIEIQKLNLKTKIFRMKPYKPSKLHSFIIDKHSKIQLTLMFIIESYAFFT